MTTLPVIPSAAVAAVAAVAADFDAQIDALHKAKSVALTTALDSFKEKDVVVVLPKGRVRRAFVTRIDESYGSPRFHLRVTGLGNVPYNEVTTASRVRALYSEQAFADAVAYKEAEAATKGRSIEDLNARARQAETYAIQASEQAQRYASAATEGTDVGVESTDESDEG